MTWTYGGDPSANSRDAVRFLIGDTDTTDQQISDEEIAYLLSTEGSDVNRAAARAVRSIMAKYARLVDKSVGDLRVSYSQRLAAYKELASELEDRATRRAGAAVFAGGISQSQKDTIYEDSDRVGPYFYREQFDDQSVLDPDPDDID